MFPEFSLKAVPLVLISCLPLAAMPSRPADLPGEARYEEKYQVWVTEAAASQTVWYLSGKKKAEGGLRQAHRDGPWTFWYENGQKRAEGTYQNGRMEGPWKLYFKSGDLQSEGDYKNSSKAGNWIAYFEGGKKKSEGTFAGGLKNGPWTEYYPTGGIFFKGQYLANLANGPWTYYFENGSFFQAGRFTEDVRTGIWKICVTPGVCGEENYRQNEPPRVSGLPRAEEVPGNNDVRGRSTDPSAILDSMDGPQSLRPGAPDWDHYK